MAILVLYLFLKLAVRLGLTGELVAAWPMWLGLALGTQLVKLDRILAEYLRLYHQKDIKVRDTRSLIGNFNIVLRRLREQPKDLLEIAELATQNVVFAAGWAGVALFGMTSTIGPAFGGASFLGKGVVLGVGLQLAIRVAKSPQRLEWFFQPIKRQLTDNEKKWAAFIFLTVFAILSFF